MMGGGGDRKGGCLKIIAEEICSILFQKFEETLH